MGLEEIKKQPEGGNLILIAETGSGPDGSSLTAYYRRSQGCGTEKVNDQPAWGAGIKLGAWHLLNILMFQYEEFFESFQQ